jgi:hypothetical protein
VASVCWATDPLLSQRIKVGFGALADIAARQWHVRFTPKSGHSSRHSACPLCANSRHGIASRQPAINRTSAPLPAASICKDRQRLMHTLATAAASSRAPSRPNTPIEPTPDAELHLRAERAEQQVADLKAALENIKSERDRWRTIAERRSLPDQPAEGTFARRESRDWWWRLNG